MQRSASSDVLSPADNTRHLSLSDGQAVVRLAKKLADGSRAGVITTMDQHDQPHARRMATVCLEDFPTLYAITSPASRELACLESKPFVDWTFGDASMTLVVHLTGKAEVVREASVINRAWKVMSEETRALFHQGDAFDQGMALIKTEVENIECTIPRDEFKGLVDSDGV